jgi:hypothetical protein
LDNDSPPATIYAPPVCGALHAQRRSRSSSGTSKEKLRFNALAVALLATVLPALATMLAALAALAALLATLATLLAALSGVLVLLAGVLVLLARLLLVTALLLAGLLATLLLAALVRVLVLAHRFLQWIPAPWTNRVGTQTFRRATFAWA